MAQSCNISLHDLQMSFGLKVLLDLNFFDDCEKTFPPRSDFEQHLLRIQRNYQNLSRLGNSSAEFVKMVILSPLLDLAEFYQAPFSLHSGQSIKISAEDKGITDRGSIDILIAKDRFWMLVVESTDTVFDVLVALPQALVHMSNTTISEKPTYGLLVNGREFVFLKSIVQPEPMYVRSTALSIERDDELAQVLDALKMIRKDIAEA